MATCNLIVGRSGDACCIVQFQVQAEIADLKEKLELAKVTITQFKAEVSKTSGDDSIFD